MKGLRRAWMRFLGLFGRADSEEELAAEMETHLQMRMEDNLRLGMPPDEARRAALLKFGGLEPAKEAYRDQRGFPLVENLWRDLRIAARQLRRAPAVSSAVIVTLALGIGSATALYAVVWAMWLRPLTYPDVGRLVSVTTYVGGYKLDALASPDYGTWQGTRSLGPLAAYSIGKAALVSPDAALEVGRASVSGNLLEVLRVVAAAGRGIQPSDDTPQAPRVAMLSDGLWREEFGAAPGVIGRSVDLDGKQYTIIGVLPRGFRMPDERRVDLLTPLALGEQWLRHGNGMKILRGVARLQPGIALEQARAELSTRLAASRAQAPELYGDDVSLRIRPLQEYVVRDARAAALVLMAAVASILLIAGANVAGLLVARAAGRAREMAVRAALGAGRLRIAQQFVAEGAVLALLGIAGGLALARVLIGLVERLRPAMLARAGAVTLNGEVVTAALVAAMLCSLACSAAPALPLPRLRLRRALVVLELALSLVLLAGAALLLESLAQLRAVAPGFRTEQLVTASLSLKGTPFAGRDAEFRRELRERLARTPGVIAVAFADALPPSDAGRITAFSRADRPLPAPFQRSDNVVVRRVDTTFFEAMGIPLLQGRAFTAADQTGAGRVAVINRTLADRYFSGEAALGKQVDGDGVPWKTVVGVVADTRNDGLRNPTRPEIDLPLTAANAQGGGITHDTGLQVVIRTAADPAATISTLRAHLRAIDRGLVAKVRTMGDEWADLTAAPRFQALVLSGFAALALVMAGTGVYGVVSHIVVLRRREIGIRMAVGATPAGVQFLVVREALLLAAGGTAIGLAGALAGTRLLASLLYHVNPRDPLMLAAAAALLAVLAIGASALPAWRASKEDPAQTLRAE